MSTPFPRWSAALAAADTDDARRALLAEILTWMPANLGEAAGQRDALWAASHLLHALGDAGQAERLARSLHALCGVPPQAQRFEVDAAEAWLGVVTGRGRPQATAASQAARRDDAPKKARPPRPERPERPERPARDAQRPAGRDGGRASDEDARIAQALGLGLGGAHKQAFSALKGLPGPRATLARTWLDLHRAMQETGDRRDQLLAALLGRLGKALPAPATDAAPAPAPPPREAKPAAAPVAAAPAEDRGAVRRAEREAHAARVEAVLEALAAETAPSVDELAPLVAEVRFVRDLLDALAALDGPGAEERVAAALQAVDRVAPDDVRLLQGASILLRHAAVSGSSGPAAEVLLRAPAARRFGGPGVDVVIALAEALRASGVAIDRILRGVTRREQREDAALDALSASVDDLWRLLVTVGGVRGEIWVVPGLSPEGRAAVPLLALRERPRLAVLRVDAPGLGGWSELGGPEAVGWTGSEGADVAAIVAGWGATAPDAG
jgi:hypothetical protein